MSLRRALRWTLPLLALMALVAWLFWPDRSGPGEMGSSLELPGMVPTRGPAAAEVPTAVDRDRSVAVARIVAEKNAESASERENFAQQGWQMVSVPPPDARLVAFDPSLLAGREEELRQQMASTTAALADAPNLARIAREAADEQTQVAAVEALGRIGSDEAQDELLELLRELPDASLARREVAPLLRPRDLSEPRATRLAQLLDSSELNAVERKQIAFTLALVGLRDRSSLPEGATRDLSGDARALLASMTSLAQHSF